MTEKYNQLIFTLSESEKADSYTDEIEEVLEWQNSEVYKEFEDIEISSPKLEKLADLNFMCSSVKSCNSFQNFGVSCKCFRSNFSSPEEVKKFAEKYLELTKQELLEIVKGEIDE